MAQQLEKYKEFVELHKKHIKEQEEEEMRQKEIENEDKNPSELKIRKAETETIHSFNGLSSAELTSILSVFNFDFYREQYDDANDLTITETLKHYLTIGKEENRIISVKHAQFVTNVPDFDILFYKQNNPDLAELTLRELCVHYLTNGLQEGRQHKEDIFDETRTLVTESSWDVKTTFTTEHDDWSKAKICIIYPYYEKKNSTKNQDNLAYFLKFGMNKHLWRKMNIKLLLMINGHQCEVSIPNQDNIIVWRKSYSNNEDGRDIGSFRKGIEFLENKYKKTFYEKFDYCFVLNSSATGPLAQPAPDYHWLDPFIEKMEIENSVICSPVINFLTASDAGGPGPRCQTYCSLIKMTQDVYSALLFTPISRSPMDTKNFSCADMFPTHACVLDIHKTTADVILFGEYGLTRVLLDNGYNISCLIYDNIDYHDKSIWNRFSDRVDRIEDYKINFFDKALFIKNNWIVDAPKISYRDSLPVLYENTNNKIHRDLSWIDIFKWHNQKIKYDLSGSHFPENGQYKIGQVGQNDSYVFGNWSNKEDFYRLFGESEGLTKFPIIENNTLVAIYTHFDPENIIRDYVVSALKALMVAGYDVIFNTTCSNINNVSLPFKVNTHSIPNNVPVKDKHALMYAKCFLNTKFSKYSHVLYVNSMYVLPTHGIENMNVSIDSARQKGDFWMLYDTRGIVYDNTCTEFSKKCVPLVRHFFIQLLNTKKTNIATNIEIELPYLLIKSGFSFHSHHQYPNFSNFQELLKSYNCFAISIHHIQKFVIESKLVIKNPVLRYLIRYLNMDDFRLAELGNQ